MNDDDSGVLRRHSAHEVGERLAEAEGGVEGGLELRGEPVGRVGVRRRRGEGRNGEILEIDLGDVLRV